MADAAATTAALDRGPAEGTGSRAVVVAAVFALLVGARFLADAAVDQLGGLPGLKAIAGGLSAWIGLPATDKPLNRFLFVAGAALVLAALGRGLPALRVRSSQALAAGLIFVALSEFALWAIGRLPVGTLRSMGPAALPTWLAIGVELCSFALIAAAFGRESERLKATDLAALSVLLLLVLPFPVAAVLVLIALGTAVLRVGLLDRLGIRGPALVFVGISLFALTIRPFNLTLPGAAPFQFGGLIFAGPLALIVGGYATPEARLRELLVLAFGLTAFCMLLFGDLLNLPIPLYPQWLADWMQGVNPGLTTKAVLRIIALMFIGAAVLTYAVGRSLGRTAASAER
jgi:hypothetical protein